MRNGNLLKSRVSEICVKRIRVNQGVGVLHFRNYFTQLWSPSMEQVFALIRSLCFAHRTMVPLFTFFFHKWQCVWFESMVAGWQFHIRPSYFFQCCFDSECAPVHEEVTLGLLNFGQGFLSNYPNTFYFSIWNLEYCLFVVIFPHKIAWWLE